MKVAFKTWKSFWEYERNVKNKFRYIHNQETNQFLQEVLSTSHKRERIIEKGSNFWRARHGWEVNQDGFWQHSKKGMTPKNYNPQEGRVNPKGIPYLYLATTIKTCISEIRPWLGSPITVAKFRIEKEQRIIDCSNNIGKNYIFYSTDPNKPYKPTKEETEDAVWSDIDKSFSRPIIPNENEANYIPTQIISELFKSEGYDGIFYKSMLGDGNNLVLFDVDAAKCLAQKLYEINKVDIDYQELPYPL